jgi:hypothetical protein
MSPPGRPKGEYRSAQREGPPIRGAVEGQARSARRRAIAPDADTAMRPWLHDARRRHVNARTLLLGLWILAGMGSAADTTREVHGSSDIYAAPGVALAWGVLRGANERATTVVLRVVTDPALYPWLAVAGIDPFTKAEQPAQPPTASSGSLDVRIPRAQFADYPRTELRLYASAAAARGGAPALMIFYHGVPDTTPEFTDPGKLEAHLAARIAHARAAGGKVP